MRQTIVNYNISKSKIDVSFNMASYKIVKPFFMSRQNKSINEINRQTSRGITTAAIANIMK